jgi:hypothetical protein
MKDKIYDSDGKPPEPIIGSDAYQDAVIKADYEEDGNEAREDAKIE